MTAYKKLNSIPTDYETFSRQYDKLHAASARIGKAADYGFSVVREGEYLANDGLNNTHRVANAISQAGFDPRQSQDFDPRYTGPNRRRNTPDMPYPQDELRHDDPRYQARARAKAPRPI